MRLLAFNPSTVNLEKSFLSFAYSVGVTSILVKNNNNFAVNDRIMLGEMGREGTEIVTVSAVNADKITMTVGATKFPHSADDPVYQLRYDSIIFYRSTAGIGGPYGTLATVPIDVDNADKETYYNDDTGLSSYYYYITYYNTPAAIESSASDPMPGEGFARNQVGSVVNDFLEEVDDLDQTYITVPQCLAWFNEVNDDLSLQSSRPYRFLKKHPAWTLDTIAGNNRIALPTDMTFLNYVQYDYDYGFEDKPRITIIPMSRMDELTSYNSSVISNTNELQYVAIDSDTTELVLYPTPATSQADVIVVHGWTNFNEVTGMGDILQTPNSRIYKMFLAARYWRKRSVKEKGFQALSAAYQNDYTTEIIKLQRANKIDKGSPSGMVPDMYPIRNSYGRKHRA